MTVPAPFDPGDLAPSAWANLQQRFQSGFAYATANGLAIPSGSVTTITSWGSPAGADPENVINNPSPGDISIPNGEFWMCTLSARIVGGSSPSNQRFILEMVVTTPTGGAGEECRTEQTTTTPSEPAGSIGAALLGQTQPWLAKIFTGGPGGNVVPQSTTIMLHRIAP